MKRSPNILTNGVSKNYKNKAFTLIELLAVIVILAIIALIAVPIILNIVEKSKKSAFQDSAYGLIESTKLLYTEGVLDGDSKDQVFEFGEGKTNNLKYSGSAPKGGSIVLTSEGEIEVAIHNNEWCATKGKDESKITIKKYLLYQKFYNAIFSLYAVLCLLFNFFISL